MDFYKQGYTIIKKAILKETAYVADIQFKLCRDFILFKNKNLKTSDPIASTNNFSWYAPLCFEALLISLQEKIEKKLKTKLYPSYSYGRIYYKNSKLNKHRDRKASEVAATININDNGEPWDLQVIDLQGKTKAIKLAIGDMCIYRGNDIIHWREERKNKDSTGAFLFYVTQKGKYADQKFDKRPMLGLPGFIHDKG